MDVISMYFFNPMFHFNLHHIFNNENAVKEEERRKLEVFGKLHCHKKRLHTMSIV